MGFRILLTCLLWCGGATLAGVLGGQTYTNSLFLIGGCVLVMVLWVPLLWKKPRPSVGARIFTALVIAGNLLLIFWTSLQLPEARGFQRQLNDSLRQDQDAVPGAGQE